MFERLFVLVACIILTATAACGEDDPNPIFLNEDGDEVELFLKFWSNADPENGDLLYDTCNVGDLGIGYSIQTTGEYVSFSYTVAENRQLAGGKWVNDLDLVVKESDIEGIELDSTFYATLFIWNTNDRFNFVVDSSLPYPTEGHGYPSLEMPMFRHLRTMSD